MSGDDGIDWGSGYEVVPDPDEAVAPGAAAEQKPNGQGQGASPPPPAAEADWPVPDPAMFHGLAGEVVATILPHTEADAVALLLQYLASFGNTVGRSRYYPISFAQHYGNLFVLLVGDTSKARKGSSADAIRPLFKICDPTWTSGGVRSGLATGEGLIHCVRDPVYAMRKGNLECVDAGVVDKRFLALETEFSKALAVMKREGNTLSHVLRDAWDGRERLDNLTKHSPATATNACISLVGHTTREELRRTLDEVAMADGFANRMLFTCVRRSKLLPFGGAITPETMRRLGEETREAMLAAQVTAPMRMDEAAGELWRRVYSELSSAGEGLLAHITARAEAQTVRLALIYALLDRAEAIGLPHLEAALALWRYCEASARCIFKLVVSEYDHSAVILRNLQDAGADGMSMREVHALFSRNLGADKLKRVLMDLKKKGLARREVRKTTLGPGRPRETWFIV